MKNIIRFLLAALLAVLIVVTCWVAVYLETLNRVTADLPVTLDRAIAREGAQTRAMIAGQVGRTSDQLNGQLTALNETVAKLGQDVPAKAEEQIALFRADLNGQLTTLNASLNRNLENVTLPARDTRTEAKALLPPIQSIVNHTAETAELALDCDHNADCVYNRYVGTARAVEKTSVSVQKMADAIAHETPETAAAVKNTSKDLAVIVNRFARPVSAVKGIVGQALNWAGKFFGF